MSNALNENAGSEQQYSKLSIAAAMDLATQAFLHNRVTRGNAESTARALVMAEADGQIGHGLSRIPSYALQARTGKVKGDAEPTLKQTGVSVLAVNADYGFAYPAIDLAIESLVPLAKDTGIAMAAVSHSHHFGQAGAHAENLAKAGLVALVFGNSPKGIAYWGGKAPMMGTNPIAFAAPIEGRAPLVIDLAVSVAARGKIVAAQKAGKSIPEGWALDQTGAPTTDPNAALQGSMVPIGGAKGAALAMMVEILAAALTGGNFGFEASSLFTETGDAPNLGQTLIAIDPDHISGGAFASRMVTFISSVEEEEGARLPGESRLVNRASAQRDGLMIPNILLSDIQNLM